MLNQESLQKLKPMIHETFNAFNKTMNVLENPGFRPTKKIQQNEKYGFEKMESVVDSSQNGHVSFKKRSEKTQIKK